LLFALALTAGILNLVDRQIIAVLKPTIAADLHWSDDDYGTLAALFQTGAAFGFLAAGWLVDRLGVRRANAFGVAAWSLAAMAHGWARSFSAFMACRISLGASEAMGTPAGIKTMAAIFSPEQRSTGIGLSNAINSIGAILAPLAIPVVAAVWGWRTAFMLAGALGLVWAGAWWLATRGVDFQDTPSGPARLDGRPVWREARTWTIAGAKVLSDATWFLMLFWMPDYFHRAFGLAGTELGPPLALAYAGAALGSVLAGTLSSRWISTGGSIDRVRKRVMLVSALAVVPVPLALLAPGAWGAAAVLAWPWLGTRAFPPACSA
jgi:ACS family hexuronate transporter-like MFS transporter